MSHTNPIRIAMITLDTSHARHFARLLNDATDPEHVPGSRVVAAFPGGSPDFSRSISRVGKFTEAVRERGVEIVGSISELREKCDAVMLMSIDGRVHLPQFREVAEWGVPVFISKPFTDSGEEAREIIRIAQEKGVRVTSTSPMRYAQKFQETLTSQAAVIGGDFYGPMPLEDKCPGYFWYGIHCAEMLFAALGTGCREVLAVRGESYDVVVGRWADGRLGTMRGNKVRFGGTLHGEDGSVSFDVSTGTKPYYVSMLEKVIPFLRGEAECVPMAEMVEVIRFLEAANQSAANGCWVKL